MFTEDLYLYREVKPGDKAIYFSVKNNSGAVLIDNFEILEHNTLVTAAAVTIRWWPHKITLTMMRNTFSFYQDLFPTLTSTVSITAR